MKTDMIKACRLAACRLSEWSGYYNDFEIRKHLFELSMVMITENLIEH